MIDPLIRPALESPYRWLIVTIVTLVIGFVLLWPLVDVYSNGQADKTRLTEELAQARLVVETLPAVESQLAERLEELRALERGVLDEKELGPHRSHLIDIARQSGCQVRRLNMGGLQTKPWRIGGDPTTTTLSPAETATAKSPIVLQWWPITITLSGHLTALKSLVTQLESEDLIFHVRQVELTPEGNDRREAQLDMEVWCYNIGLKKG